MPAPEIDSRVDIARQVLSYGIEPYDLELEPDLAVVPAFAALAADLQIPFPQGLSPVPKPINPIPATDVALPKADIAVITWTVAEQNALCDVFTPGYGRVKWYRYNRFYPQYEPKIRRGAPARNAQRLGSYFMTQIGTKSVLCIKSELHMNQDGVSAGPNTGHASLPVKDFFKQILDEVKPTHIITAGTSGSVHEDAALGDVVVTRGAKFRCQKEFRNEPFNAQSYRSDWKIPTKQFKKAEQLMSQFSQNLVEPPVGPPTGRYSPKKLAKPPANTPKIHRDGVGHLPAFHPILTTDYFEYGTTTNHLDQEGAAVEMGDAVLGMVCSEMANPPKWVVVRNMSDPLINGELPISGFRINQQTMWAVGYYEAYGYYTSVTGALAAWAIIAAL